MAISKPIESRRVRCAIYTRKSTSYGLEQDVNSLVYQREVCRSYIKCQAHRNWEEVPHAYDDGGFTGGNLQRPALKRLIADIEAGRIDVVVIYKIDRLSRSLTDFVRLMDVLDAFGASFVSVTQTFDTSDSMGRLVLNILLTFAQFERELMSDRVKDRYAARRRRGLFGGGTPPIGFMLGRGGLLIHDPERAPVIRDLYRRFPGTSATQLAKDLQERGFVTRRYVNKHGKSRGGQKFSPSVIMAILKNPMNAGYFVHRGEWIKTPTEPIVSLEEWQNVQEIMRTRFPQKHDPIRNLMLGILYDDQGRRMKMQICGSGRAKKLRYHRSENSVWARGTVCRKVMVEADRVEQLAISSIKDLLLDRRKLREAVLSLRLYSDETARNLRRGQLAARRLSLMENTQLREVLIAIISRAEVFTTGLRLLICCYELSRFLAWDGIGHFQKDSVRPRGAERFRMLYAPAELICGHTPAGLALYPHKGECSRRNPALIGMLEEAIEAKRLVLDNQEKSLGDLARERNMGVTHFSRVLRLNYLAPDIQAAIMDGTQPAELTRNKVLFSCLPLDWGQQRQLFGFEHLETHDKLVRPV